MGDAEERALDRSLSAEPAQPKTLRVRIRGQPSQRVEGHVEMGCGVDLRSRARGSVAGRVRQGCRWAGVLWVVWVV
ncbi:MAG: hypothetical protein ACK5PI_05370, partial [Acetobacteraceae bacterium]